MKRVFIAIALLLLSAPAFAATPTATATATPGPTPTPVPNCQYGVGPDWCAPAAHSTAGQYLLGGGTWGAAPNEQAATWGSTYGSVALSGALGGLTSTGAATLLGSCIAAPVAGHFTNLEIVNDLNGGSCTTAPTYNVRDNTASTTGTALAGSTTAGAVAQAQTLVFAAGDVICLVRTVNGGTCTAPIFSVIGQVSYP